MVDATAYEARVAMGPIGGVGVGGRAESANGRSDDRLSDTCCIEGEERQDVLELVSPGPNGKCEL